MLTITIYYTTRKCLVQENTCQEWVTQEFEKIKKLVEVCVKGGNSKNIVQEVRKIELPNFQSIDNSNLSLDDSILNDSETSVKSLDDSQTFLKNIDDDVMKNDEHETQGLVTIHVNILSMYKHKQGRTSFLPPLASSRVCFLNSF